MWEVHISMYGMNTVSIINDYYCVGCDVCSFKPKTKGLFRQSVFGNRICWRILSSL